MANRVGKSGTGYRLTALVREEVDIFGSVFKFKHCTEGMCTLK